MKILVCTDGSEHCDKALEEASELAVNLKSAVSVTVIHIYKRKYTDSAWSVSNEEAQETKSPAEVEEMREHLRALDEQELLERKKVLEKAAEVFKQKNLEVQTRLEEGHPAKSICEVASGEGFDLVVVGSRGRGGLWDVFLGSVSNAVVQNCATNVLVVK